MKQVKINDEVNRASGSPDSVVWALRVLGLNGDTIFSRIREDLDRGLVTDARSHLNFVDELLCSNAVSEARR